MYMESWGQWHDITNRCWHCGCAGAVGVVGAVGAVDVVDVVDVVEVVGDGGDCGDSPSGAVDDMIVCFLLGRKEMAE